MKDYILFIYGYNNWANLRVLDTVEKISQEQFLAGTGYSTSEPSIRDTLVHTMGAQEIWLARWGGVSPTRLLDPKDFGTVALIRQYWDEVEQHTRGFLDAAEDDVLLETMHYQNTKGTPFAYPRWQTMLHQVNHATQHRSEVAAILTQLGHSPGELDMLGYMQANQK
jgi:uncharacterized damage-inducible protein DinB